MGGMTQTLTGATVTGTEVERKWDELADRGDLRTAMQRIDCLLYTSPSPRDRQKSRMPSSA